MKSRTRAFAACVFAVSAFALSLTACGSSVTTASATTAVTNALTTAKADLAKAVAFYGVAKGIAIAAEFAEPSIAPFVTQAEAILDPIVAKAQLVLTDANADLPTVQALVTTIQTQATDLTVKTSAVVTVVPNAVPASP